MVGQVGQVGQVRLLPQTLFYLSYSSYPSYLIKFAPNGQVTFSRVFYEARLRRMKQNLAVLCFFAHPGKKMIGIDKKGAARRRAFAQAEATDGK